MSAFMLPVNVQALLPENKTALVRTHSESKMVYLELKDGISITVEKKALPKTAVSGATLTFNDAFELTSVEEPALKSTKAEKKTGAGCNAAPKPLGKMHL